MEPGDEILDRYDIVRALGRGGMATTFLVWDRSWEVEVALKLLRTETVELAEALSREFAVLSSLPHPRLTRVRDFGLVEPARGPGGGCFYTADLVDGEPIDRFGRGATWEAVRQPVVDGLDALRALHAAGLLHGDVKPANLLVDRGGRGVLIDLGCCRDLGAPPGSTLGGTPGFLAPELLAGRSADPRADLYTAGRTLGLLIGGLAERPPPEVVALAERLASPRPEDRPSSVDEALDALGAEPSLVHPVLGRIGRFAGRSSELAAFRTALEALLASRAGPRVFHVAAVEAMGRSRLLRELRWLAQGRCRVLDSGPPRRGAVAALLGATLGGEGSTSPMEGLIALAEGRAAPQAGPVLWVVDDAHRLEPEDVELLRALARLAEPAASVLVLAASDSELRLDGPSAERVDLGPLAAQEVAAWVGGTLTPGATATVHRLGGGCPGDVRALLLGIASGEVSEEALGRGEAGLEPGLRSARLVAAAGDRRATALLILSAVGGGVVEADLAGLGLEAALLDGLVAEGVVRRDEGGWALARLGEADRLLEAAGPEAGARAHLTVARWLALSRADGRDGAAPPFEHARLRDQGRASERSARRALHLALGGLRAEAEALLLESTAVHAEAPRPWLRAARAVARGRPSAEAELVVAELERSVGETAAALARLDRLLGGAEEAACLLSPPGPASLVVTPAEEGVQRLAKSLDRLDSRLRGNDGVRAVGREPSGPCAAAAPDLAARAGLAAASCLLRLGRPEAAVARLEATADAAAAAGLAARTADLLARALTRLGEHGRAARVAGEALARCDDAAVRVDLLEARGVALAYAGRLAEAAQDVDEAVRLVEAGADPRRRVRALGSRGLVAYAAGDLDAAARDHRAALDLAESAGLTDQVATAALNLGTACHQRGAWALAQASYERGLRMARALGQASTEALLRFDLAKLFADLGQHDRALVATDGCARAAEAAGAELLAAAADTVRAEVALARGRLAEAAALLDRAAPVFGRRGSRREQAEVEVARAEVALAAGDREGAAVALGRGAELLEGLDAGDAALRLAAARARLLLAAGRAEEALASVEGAAERARRLGHEDLEAEMEVAAAEAYRGCGAEALASRHLLRARELWEGAATRLPASAREAFLRHPRRVGAMAASPSPGRPVGPDREQRLRLILDINKRLGSTPRTSEVLDRAMDAAILLTGAERGFVLVAEEGRLVVAAARNLDKEKVAQPTMKFSRSIAEQVVATGEPLLTADALSDERFDGQASVHAMSLRSVLCVPVASSEGVLGALYLDNRFQRGRFDGEDAEVLQAFADQVAIALANARLHDELRRRNQELEEARRRADELARGQAAEIDRLTEEVRRTARPTRHDFGAIAGASRAMEELLGLLDRVVDTALPVLIQGESGTGKELVARAIHGASPRKGRGLVSVNCGALPEPLLESELFGYERGAFTGADRAREGLVVQAAGGTLFLDEVAEMPPSMQVKLLRVLQEREVRPLGSSRTLPVDFRLLSATNRDLGAEVAAGRFREDLYYRIAAVVVTIPPLRERPEDIPGLASLLLERAAEAVGRPAPSLDRAALRKLLGHPWPGNVRELEHVLARALLLGDGETLGAADLELPRREPGRDIRGGRRAYAEAEVARIAAALEEHRWNLAAAARALGIPRATLYRRIARHGLGGPKGRPPRGRG